METFGVSLNAEGTCFYGMQIEAVMDRIKDAISLDHLSRLLVDVQQDSSAIVDSIISGYQRDLLPVRSADQNEDAAALSNGRMWCFTVSVLTMSLSSGS